MDDVVLLSACRTPIGSFRSSLASLSAPQLGSFAIREAVNRAGISPGRIDEVIMGNVLSAGVGQASARQAALHAGLPTSVQCSTINKVCGSGLKAVMLAAQAIAVGDARLIVAGGMESMSNAPYLLEKARGGYRMGHAELIDSLLKDGLQDAYDGIPMGEVAEQCAKACGITRKDQDDFALLSYTRAQNAQNKGLFDKELIPVEVVGPKGEKSSVQRDEDPTKMSLDRIPTLKPAFLKEGTITAANASKISDGAAALVVASLQEAKKLGVKPLARIVAQSSFAQDPLQFSTAPIDAVKRVLEKAHLAITEIDLFEVNEAFAVVALAVQRALGIDRERLNIHGGAVALGHPIGASGARILVTLLHAMEQRNVRRGLATLCIGGGEASAIIVERDL
jgi:acetyl-CoA C-acetyltransferase